MNITNDKVTEYINSYYKALDADIKAFREESELNRIPVILKETETFLKAHLLSQKPKKILEIGSATGYSSTFFAKLLPHTQIVTIESLKERYETASKNFKLFKVNNRVKIHLGKAEEIMSLMYENGERDFDFVFIDAAKSHYIDFFKGAIRLCTKNAVIISDNVLMRAMTVSDEYDTKKRYKTNIKKLREYLDFLMADKTNYTAILAIGDGLSFTVLNYNK